MQCTTFTQRRERSCSTRPHFLLRTLESQIFLQSSASRRSRNSSNPMPTWCLTSSIKETGSPSMRRERSRHN